MKINSIFFALLFSLFLIGCGAKEEKKQEGFSVNRTKTTEKKAETPVANLDKPSERVDLSTKGVGPVKSITLDATIDRDMAVRGEEVYNKMCLACHRIGKKFIGPPPNGILEKRTPEWVMNMILNPEGMVKDDPLARELLMEFNGSPMANQGLTQDEAREIVEYFRTLE